MEVVDFEYTILKSLVHDGLYFNKCFDILRVNYFKNVGNKELFKLLKNYYNEYKQRPQEVALSTMIKNIPNAETRKIIVESLKVLKTQDLNSNTEFMCNETVKYIKDMIYYKSLEIGSEGLMEKNENKIKKAQALVEEMNKVQLDSDLGLDFDNIEEQIEYFSKREYGLKTAHKSINKRLGTGFLPGTLNVILAAQGVGKSLLMCDFMSTMLQDNKNILMVSLEMSENEMMKRINANVFDIDINSFRDLSKTQGELDQLERPQVTKDMILGAYEKYKVQGKCGKLFIKEFPAGSFSANMLGSLVQKFENEKGIKFDIIFIDYLGIMKSDLLNPNAGLYAYVKSIGEEVRAQAVKLQVPIVSASQLNRSLIGKTDGDNSSISDSIGTAMTADFMLFCLQSEEMKKNCEMVMKVTKNRYTGITDTFMMNINYPKMRFSDIIENQSLPENGTINFSTPSQAVQATNFANNEVRQIVQDDMKKIKEHDSKIEKQKDELLDLLGL